MTKRFRKIRQLSETYETQKLLIRNSTIETRNKLSKMHFKSLNFKEVSQEDEKQKGTNYL